MSKRIARWSLVLVGGLTLAAVSPSVVRADVIQLKDGTRLEGEIKRADDGWLVTGEDGKPRFVAGSRVASIEAKPKTDSATADARLASLRRAVENATDLRQIVERYRQFITQFDGTPASDKARVDLQTWQDRLEQGLVKVGDKWVTPDEKAQIQEKSFAVARDVVGMLRQGRLREATPALDKALAENPQAGALWYLKGVLHYRQDQLPQARKAFESALNLMPDHAPTLNNLAVILWRQNAFAGSLNDYDRALLAAPANRQVLDNLAEALNALPEDHRNTPATKKVVRHFNEQDRVLQDQMARAGMYRWGSTFVARADLDKLKAAEKEIEDKLAEMSRDFDANAARLTRIDSDLEYDQKAVRRMELDSYGIDAATGRAIRYPLPAGYGDLLRDIAALKAERSDRLTRQDQLRAAARQIQQKLPTPKYTGSQRLIDVEGTPIPGIASAVGAAAPPAPAPAPEALPQPAPPAPPFPPAPAPPAPPAPATQAAPPITPGSVGPPPEKPSILDRRA
jgi:Tfp pilus assembly protein PilF